MNSKTNSFLNLATQFKLIFWRGNHGPYFSWPPYWFPFNKKEFINHATRRERERERERERDRRDRDVKRKREKKNIDRERGRKRTIERERGRKWDIEKEKYL